MIVILERLNPKVTVNCGQFWFPGSRQLLLTLALTSVSLPAGVSIPAALSQISQHLFSCTPFDVLCDRAAVPVTGWPRLYFVRPSHLCCVLSCVSLSLCSACFSPALSFCLLSMIWWALQGSVRMVFLLACVCVCTCAQAFNFVWCTWACVISQLP